MTEGVDSCLESTLALTVNHGFGDLRQRGQSVITVAPPGGDPGRKPGTRPLRRAR
jgi:hypothetical protein